MYPYRNRLRWFLFGRYSHLARAIRDRRAGLQDTILDSRISSLRVWNSIRFAVSLVLSIGVLATALAAIARALPGGTDDGVVVGVVTFASALTGLLTVAYLFLTRLLGQIEIEILAI
ncbi:MAG: hypothetical protein WC876_09030, partial [Candidatus Thermoplasmatota archaeon]